MPYTIKGVYSNYSLPDALCDSDGNETMDKPACSTEEEGIMEEEGGSGGSNVVLGQHSTAGIYQHYIKHRARFKGERGVHL